MQPEHSATYMQLITSIEKNWLTEGLSEFDQHLAQLEQTGHITLEEYRALLKLYIAKIKGQ